MKPENSTLPRRTVSPVYWLLFGAGGMLAALFGPALIIITGFMIPHSWSTPSSSCFGGYDKALAFIHNPIGKLVTFVVIALFFWHAAERLFLTLTDMHAGQPGVLRWATYGVAALLTLVAAFVLLAIGF